MTKTGIPGLDLHLDVERARGRVGRSLEDALREAVRSGRLPAGTRLPGTRTLAADLGVARGTVVQAYTQLVAEGWLSGTSGSGTRVSDPAARPGERPAPAPPAEIDLRPGRPDLRMFPRTVWAAAVRRALASAGAEVWDYGHPFGVPALREAIAEYTARARGVRAEPEAVVIVGGFAAGLALLGRALGEVGVRNVATENPGLERHRRLLRAAGLGTPPLRVDAHGADPDGLTASTRAALLTPAHQHPRGVVLSSGRRAALVAWARESDGFLVEDDYDGEFRYDRRPVGALQALAPERVVFAGSASKTLAPGTRLGWLIVPPVLREPLRRAIEDTGASVPVIGQLALADLVTRGDYDRHIRRARLSYRRRRDQLARGLAVPLPGVAAGLHALLPVGSAEQERRLVETGRYAGLLLHGLHTAGYWHEPTAEHEAALVLGFGTPPQHAWRRALDGLRELVDAVGLSE